MALNIIPTIGQSLDETRDPILNNFTYIDNGFGANHVQLNTGGQSGLHTAVNFVNQIPPPAIGAPSTGALQSMIYAAPSILSNPALDSALFIKGANQDNTVTGTEFTAASFTGNGFTVLPSGIFLLWGSMTISGPFPGTMVAYNLPAALPTGLPNGTLVVVPGRFFSGSTINTYTITIQATSKTGFTAYASQGTSIGNNITGSYIAIGY